MNRKDIANAKQLNDILGVKNFTCDRLLTVTEGRQKARTLAKSNSPPNDSELLSIEEEEIIGEVADFLSETNDSVINKAESLSVNKPDISILATVNKEVIDFQDQVEDLFRDISNQNDNEIKQTQEKIGLMLSELNIFKSENVLEREADYSKGLKKWFIFVLIFIGEFGFNGFQLAAVSSGGLGTAALVSLATTLVIIVFAGLSGVFSRAYNYHSSVSLIKKAGSVFLIVLFFPAAFTSLLYAANYRVALEKSLKLSTDIEVYTSAFWRQNVLETVGDISANNNAFIMLLLGVLVIFVSIRKGYYWDDVYPNYGKKHRKLIGAIKDYENAIGTLSDEYESLRVKLLNELDVIASKISKVKASANEFNKNIGRFTRALDQAERLLNKELRLAISIFRNENKAVRTDNPPEYFSKQIELVKVASDKKFSSADYEISMKEIDICLTAFNITLTKTKEKINKAFKGKISYSSENIG